MQSSVAMREETHRQRSSCRIVYHDVTRKALAYGRIPKHTPHNQAHLVGVLDLLRPRANDPEILLLSSTVQSGNGESYRMIRVYIRRHQ